MSVGVWRTAKIGEVCDFSRGLTYKKTDEVDFSSNAVLRANNIALGKGVLNFDEIKYISDDISISESKLVKKNSVLVCTASGSKSHLGKTAFIDDDYQYAFGGFMGLLTPRSELDGKYLYWVTASKAYSDFIAGLSDGANINNLKFSQLSEFSFPIPSLDVQKRIVAIVDEAFAGIDTAIANTEKNLANARELFESYLNLIFAQPGLDWKERSLDDVCGIDSSLIDPRKEEFIDLPHIGAGNIVSKTGELLDVKTAREEGLKSGKFLFDEKMVLYSKIRPYLEKVVRPDFNGLCSADIYPLMPKEGLLVRDFLYYLLLSRQFTDYAIAGSARAGMPKVNRNHLFQYVTSFPEVSIQEKLSDQLNSIEIESKRLELIYLEKLNSLKELKQSLLKKAFSGELTAEADKLMDEAVA